jgi:hypothetical protein
MNVVFFVVALSSLTWRYGVCGGGDVLLYKIIQAYVVEFLSMKKQLL